MAVQLIVVHIIVALFNFAASVSQGITGFGDTLILEVFLYTTNLVAPGVIQLGTKPLLGVTVLTYVRNVFSMPFVAWLSFNEGVFSKTMTLAMAIPSSITAILGLVAFTKMRQRDLKLIGGTSTLFFALLYIAVLATQYISKIRLVKRLLLSKSPGIIVIPEAEVVAQQLDACRRNNMNYVNNMSFPSNTSFVNNNMSFLPPLGSATETPVTSIISENPGDQIVISTSAEAPYILSEAVYRPINEDGTEPPPLVPELLTPTRTMTYTRARVNRNLDANGRIKPSAKIGGAVAMSFAGFIGSITGVSAHPQVLFLRIFDMPGYIMRVNFAMQALPSAATRFVVACAIPLFHADMIPILINVVISGCCGIVVGMKVGKLLGPKSFNMYVLSLMILAVLKTISDNKLLLGLTFGIFFCLIIGLAWYEKYKTAAAPMVEAQREMEAEIDAYVRAAALDNQNMIHEASIMETEEEMELYDLAEHPPLPLNRGSSSNLDSESVTSGSSRVTCTRKADLNRPPPLFRHLDADMAVGCADSKAAQHALETETERPVIVPISSLPVSYLINEDANERCRECDEEFLDITA